MALREVTNGFYWATHKKYGWRRIICIGRDGFNHTRAWPPGISAGSFNVEEFKDLNGPLIEGKRNKRK